MFLIIKEYNKLLKNHNLLDEEDDDSNIWTRLKEKFGLKLKK